MSIFSDATTIFTREMLIFKSSLRVNLIRSMMFPLIIIIFFGNLGNAISNVPVAVANYANNQQSLQFISALQAQGTLSISAATDQASAMSLLQTGKVDIVVVILPTFPGSSPSVYVYYAGSQFSSIGAALPFIEGAAEQFGAHAGAQAAQLASSQFVVTQPTSGANSSYRNFLIAGVIIMATAFGSIFSGGFSVILDRQLGNMKAFFITPISTNAIVLGKLMSGTVQSMIYGLLAMVLGLLLGATIALGPLGVLWIMLILFFVSIAFSAIALLVASRLTKIELYAIVAQMLVMPLWFLSGSLFPASSFPAILQPFSAVDPLTYATDAMRQVMLAGYIIPQSMLLDLSVIVAFSLAAVAASFLIFKKTID